MILRCEYRTKRIGTGDAKCAGAVAVYYCKLLQLPCIAHQVQVYSIEIKDHSIPKDDPLYCNLCQYNTSGQQGNINPSC